MTPAARALLDTLAPLRGIVTPRVHGNAMIQIDVAERVRVHVWGDPRIPRQRVQTPIHDHRFDFESTVVVGRLFNLRYEAKSYEGWGMTHELHRPIVREGEDTVLAPTGQRVRLFDGGARMQTVGSTYVMRIGEIHEAFAIEPTVTILRKGVSAPTFEPSVYVPLGTTPDNDFNRNGFDQEYLWTIVTDALEGRYL